MNKYIVRDKQGVLHNIDASGYSWNDKIVRFYVESTTSKKTWSGSTEDTTREEVAWFYKPISIVKL